MLPLGKIHPKVQVQDAALSALPLQLNHYEGSATLV